MKNVFARDENGKIKTKKPCQTPGCKSPNWHICLEGKPDTFPQLLKQRQKKTGMDQAHRDAIAAAQRERWSKIVQDNQERDDTIIKLYNEEELGMNAIARKTGYAQSTVNKVLHKAAIEGWVVIRPKGFTRRRPGV